MYEDKTTGSLLDRLDNINIELDNQCDILHEVNKMNIFKFMWHTTMPCGISKKAEFEIRSLMREFDLISDVLGKRLYP
jgi:hypothetical protein